MKIDSSYKPSVANVTANAKPATPPRAQEQPSAQEAVTLSTLGVGVISTEKPPINTARIQEIKQAISEGRFKINPEAIASSLIDSAKDLVKYAKNQA